MKMSEDREAKVCETCRFSLLIKATGDLLCDKRGVVPADFSCGKFVYDPLKRIPRRPPAPPIPDRFELEGLL